MTIWTLHKAMLYREVSSQDWDLPSVVSSATVYPYHCLLKKCLPSSFSFYLFLFTLYVWCKRSTAPTRAKRGLCRWTTPPSGSQERALHGQSCEGSTSRTGMWGEDTVAFYSPLCLKEFPSHAPLVVLLCWGVVVQAEHRLQRPS